MCFHCFTKSNLGVKQRTYKPKNKHHDNLSSKKCITQVLGTFCE